MKKIDPKSVLIGVLATALVIACTDSSKPTSIISEAKAETGVNDKWDMNQEWEFTRDSKYFMKGGDIIEGRVKDGKLINHIRVINGWEPFAVGGAAGNNWQFRRRVK